MNTTGQKFSLLRLGGAIVVAFVASMTWFAIYCEGFGFVGSYLGNLFTGFSGVFVGTFCFRRQHRLLGSVILLIGGTAIDGFFEDSDDKVYPLSVVWVALGGLAAAAFYYLRRRANKSLQPTPGGASVGNSHHGPGVAEL